MGRTGRRSGSPSRKGAAAFPGRLLTVRVEWSHGALGNLERLDPPTRERVLRAVERFGETGHGDVRRVQGTRGELALRVGKWRTFFVIDREEQCIRVLRVRPRASAYR